MLSFTSLFAYVAINLILWKGQVYASITNSSVTSPLNEHDQMLLLQGEGCLDNARLDTLYTYYELISDSTRRKRVSIFEADNTLQSILFDENDFRIRYKGSRTFITTEDVLGYFQFLNGDMNGFGRNFGIISTNIQNITCESEDVIAVDVMSQWFVNFNNAVNPERQVFIFESGSNLVRQVDSMLPHIVNSTLLALEYDRKKFCDSAAISCPGEMYPFQSLQDCYDTTANIQDVCTSGVTDEFTQGVLQGDTMACRLLHLVDARIRPKHHCPFLRASSDACLPLECPANIRNDEPLEVVDEFDPTSPSWLRWFVIIFIAAITLFGLISYIWFYHQRSLFKNLVTDDFMVMASEADYSSKYDMPMLSFENMTLALKNVEDGVDDTIIHFDKGFLGGCRMTCITGESGSGKTSFMKLLCGFDQPHMTLRCGKWIRRAPVGLCPQHADMWPQEMMVKDALFFACTLSGGHIHDYKGCFEELGLINLLDQQIGTLSGGQLQRLNIAASVVRSEPSIIFLDEPLAALDEDNSLACLKAIKNLPVRHAFAITVHSASPAVAAMFDRAIHLDKQRKTMFEYKNLGIEMDFDSMSSTGINVKDRVVWNNSDSFKAAIVLWYGQFFGIPFVELLLTFCSIMGAIVVGFLARKSTVDWQDESSYFPTRESSRVPLYVNYSTIGAAFTTSFGGALIYANRERQVMNHFRSIRLMSPSGYLAAMLLLRSFVHGVIQAAAWIFVTNPIIGYTADLDMIFTTMALFIFSWSAITFAAAIAQSSSLYSSHIVMIMDVFMVFFSGPYFFFDNIYGIFKAIHYICPNFYSSSAVAYVVALSMDNGCGPTQFPGECASGRDILSMAEIQPFSIALAQGIQIIFALAAFIWTLLFFKRRGRDCIGPNETVDENEAKQNMAASIMQSSIVLNLLQPTRNTFRGLTQEQINEYDIDWADVELRNTMRKSERLSLLQQKDLQHNFQPQDSFTDNDDKVIDEANYREKDGGLESLHNFESEITKRVYNKQQSLKSQNRVKQGSELQDIQEDSNDKPSFHSYPSWI